MQNITCSCAMVVLKSRSFEGNLAHIPLATISTIAFNCDAVEFCHMAGCPLCHHVDQLELTIYPDLMVRGHVIPPDMADLTHVTP